MSVVEKLKNRFKKRKNGLVIEADWGWVGPKPAGTKAEKIRQIKTDFIDERTLLVVGAEVSDFEEYPFISATISTHELIEYVGEMSSDERFLVIRDMDKVPFDEQENFVPLLKNRQILSENLPENVQIIMPVTDEKNISENVKTHVFTVRI